MGEAKRRGTYEQRVQRALERKEALRQALGFVPLERGKETQRSVQEVVELYKSKEVSK